MFFDELGLKKDAIPPSPNPFTIYSANSLRPIKQVIIYDRRKVDLTSFDKISRTKIQAKRCGG